MNLPNKLTLELVYNQDDSDRTLKELCESFQPVVHYCV